MDLKQYEEYIEVAVAKFWDIRSKQTSEQQKRDVKDQGTRSAVTGGKQLDGFIDLLKKIAIDAGIPEEYIYTSGTDLPGFFRATKQWDLLIIAPNKHFIAGIELKSQVGSFGNNFNNRTEEAIGSAVDLWTAYREKVFPKQQQPWLGYAIIVEKSEKSTSTVSVREPYFKVMPEFKKTSYLERYCILCKKLMLERHYSSTAILWTSSDKKHGDVSSEVSIYAFLESFAAFLQGKLSEFKKK